MRALSGKIHTLAVQIITGRVAISICATLILAIAVSTALISLQINSIKSVEERAGALPWTLFSDATVEERVAIVAIDERSLNSIGPWPWSREVMAELTDAIGAAGAQVQIHDIVYPVGERPGDDLFARALLRNEGAIIAQLPVLQSQDSPLQSGALTHPLGGIACGDATTGSFLPGADSYIASSDLFAAVPKGHIAPVIDPDGAIRKVPALICNSGLAYPALALAPFLQLMNAGEEWSADIADGEGLLAPAKILRLGSYPGLEIPLDNEGNFRLSYDKTPDSFRSVSAVDILEGNFDPEMFDNVLVLVGATAFGLDDIVPTPYSGFSPGVELQARALTSILDGNLPYSPQGKPVILSLAALFLALVSFVVASRRGRLALFGLPAISLAAPAVAIGIHGVLLTSYGLWIGWVLPGMFGFFGGLMLLVVELARVRFERSRVMQNLTSYLPSDTARKVAFELPSSSIQAERCNVTLLSADLRNFSALGERRPPEESASVLHYFFTKVNTIVERYDGRVHEYKGDNVLVVWDGDGTEPATKALAAAIEIEREVNANLLPEVGIEGLEPLAVGIGIEQGPVLMGSIGPAHRRAHTLCGETVSVTLRIQEMTADLASPILIGEVAARYMSDANLESLGHYLLPGLITAHILFTPANQAPTNEVSSTRDGLTLLKGGLG
tara:strand:- start:25391 stop:27406 length:2016 start_codon:yes stop_codon:yes gene_type:complete